MSHRFSRRVPAFLSGPFALEPLENRILLACTSAHDDWCSGGWRLVANPNINTGVPAVQIDFPDGSRTGTALEIYYEIEKGEAPLSRVLLNNGFVRQASHAGPLGTSFRNFQYYSSADNHVDVPIATNMRVLGVNAQDQLTIEATYFSADAKSGNEFGISASYVLDPPNSVETTMLVSLDIDNKSGEDVRPFGDGHRDLDEQWRLFGLSSMYVARDYAAGLPSWYDELDPKHQYVGDLDDSDPINDAFSQHGSEFVPAHDTAKLSTDNVELVLAHEQSLLPSVVIEEYEWHQDTILYRDPSPWLSAEHAHDPDRNQRVEIVEARGLVNSVDDLSWSIRYDRDDVNMVDGDNVRATLGIDSLVDIWPAGSSQHLTLRLTSGPGVASPSSPSSTIQIVDNGDSDFHTAGSWNRVFGMGHENDVAFTARGSGRDVASWSFAVPPGEYQISASWTPHPNRATNAPFSILDGSKILAQVSVNQEQAPDDLDVAGTLWEHLGGPYTVTDGSLVVKLSDAADEYVIADAVRVERLGDPPPAPPPPPAAPTFPDVQIVDDGDVDFRIVGVWKYAVNQGYENDVFFTGRRNASDVASWTFAVEPGQYQISASWSAHANRATDAPFTIRDGNTELNTLNVNQEKAPNDVQDAGMWWDYLGDPVQITGSTLVVELSGAADEFVIADAVRIERVKDQPPPPAPPPPPPAPTFPDVQIVDDGDVDFRTVGVWKYAVNQGHENDVFFTGRRNASDIASWTFAVEPGQYQISASWSAHANRATDAPFTIRDGNKVTGTLNVNQENAPDDLQDAETWWEHLGDPVQITGSTLIVELSGAADEFVIADAVRIERVKDQPRPPPPPPPTSSTGAEIIDNGDSGFRTEGSWKHVVGRGFHNDIDFTVGGQGSDVASWSFSVRPGRYQVSASWSTDSNHATDSPFTIRDGNTVLSTLNVNQEKAPNDVQDAGTWWDYLGDPVQITGSTLVVELSGAADEFVIADAVRIERVKDLPPEPPPPPPPPPSSTAQIIDNGDDGFQTEGNWKRADGLGYQNDVHLAVGGVGRDAASWTFVVKPGQYQVSAHWSVDVNNATNAPFTILDGNTLVGELRVNQEKTPDDLHDAGTWWEHLGDPVNVTGSTVVIKLSGTADEFVIADAVRVERVGDLLPPPPPPPSAPAPVQIIDNGDEGFQIEGNWKRALGQGHQNDVDFIVQGNARDVARWSFAVPPGEYEISASWSEHANRATNASFTIRDGSTILAKVKVNQRKAPVDFSDAATSWEKLGGPYNIIGGKLVVELSGAADGSVIADAIRIERMD